MKKLLIGLSFFFLLAQPLAADTSSKVTLADAIYADLATRQALDNVSIYYSDGKSSNDVKLNEGRYWLPASTVKTFAAMYAFKLVADGKIYLSDYVTIDSKNEVPTELVTPELPTLTSGDSITIERLLRQMITQSDNTAFNQLVDLLGRGNITKYIESLGLIHSHVGSKLNLDDSQTQYEYDNPEFGVNTTTAQDYAKAFSLIKGNKIAGAKDLYAILKEQKINNMIPLYLPKDVVCAHKTGDLNPLFHDGGICQDKKQSYVLTIFTNYGSPELLAHLSELIYTKNFNLVGATLTKSTIGKAPDIYPLDPLVMKPVEPSVLGANTLNFPTPDLTPADLGIKPADLTLIIKNDKLPQDIIPPDSPFHGLSDAWQITKKAFVLGPQARRNVDLETAELRLADAKDLLTKAQATNDPTTKSSLNKKAQNILQDIQKGILVVRKDPTISNDPVAQNTLEAIAETGFAIAGEQLKKTTGEDRLTWIKKTSENAHEYLAQKQEIPQAISPAQKIIKGTVIDVTDKGYVIKTPAQQIITIPNSPATTIQHTAISQASPTPSELLSPSPTILQSITPENSPRVLPSPTQAPTPITIGSTIAIAGTQRGTTFAASVIVPNVPKEFIAPEPVTVAKVNVKDNTMVTIEGGVYTQVNINKDTIIKGKDTTIPLNEIQPGDVVVVHGQPLTETTPTLTPTVPTRPVSLAPTQKISVSQTQGNTPSPQPSTPTSGKTNIPNNAPISQVQKTIPSQPATSIPPTLKTTQPSPATQVTPKVIQSTSIQVIEKKQDIPKNPSVTTPSQPKPPQQNSSSNQPKSQPPQPPQQSSVTTGKTGGKKK